MIRTRRPLGEELGQRCLHNSLKDPRMGLGGGEWPGKKSKQSYIKNRLWLQCQKGHGLGVWGQPDKSGSSGKPALPAIAPSPGDSQETGRSSGALLLCGGEGPPSQSTREPGGTPSLPQPVLSQKVEGPCVGRSLEHSSVPRTNSHCGISTCFQYRLSASVPGTLPILALPTKVGHQEALERPRIHQCQSQRPAIIFNG